MSSHVACEAQSSSDPAFKLFGKRIESCCLVLKKMQNIAEKSVVEHEDEAGDDDHDYLFVSPEFGSSSGSNDACDEDNPSHEANGTVIVVPAHDTSNIEDNGLMEGEDAYTGGYDDHFSLASEKKALKKPDKPIPCPRCNSLNTKFCYYNNYSVNQPRYFCKSCQRYWTAGGVLRSMPVGAGCRKNQQLRTCQRKNLLSQGFAARLDSSECREPRLSQHKKAIPPSISRDTGVHLLPQASLGCIESSLSSAVSNSEHEILHKGEVLQGFNSDRRAGHESFQGIRSCCQNRNSEAEDGSMNCLDSNHNRSPFAQPANRDCMLSPSQSHQLSFLEAKLGDSAPFRWAPGPPVFPFIRWPWPYAESAGSGNMLTTMAAQFGGVGISNGSPMPSPPWSSGALGSLCMPGLPWPLFQNPLLMYPVNCGGISWTPAAASMAAAAATAAAAAATPTQRSQNVVLGKHLHEGAPDQEQKLVIPKTLRISDSADAVQSSILATLGIDSRSDLVVSGDVYSGFHNNMLENKGTDALHAAAQSSNPAALLRSVAFQESNLQ